MFRKAWSWVSGLSDLLTLVQFAGSLGLAGLLAIVGQGVAGAALQLSPILRLLLGVCIFLMVLAATLAGLKALLERTAATGKVGVGSEGDRSRAEIREQERERQQLLSRIERQEAEVERLRERCESLTVERDALRERAEQTGGLMGSRPRDELRRRYFRVSGELFRFADERDDEDPQKRPEETPGWLKRSRKGGDHDDETKVQYSKRFGGEVGALLDGAEQRKWIEPGERQRLEGNITSTFTFTGLTARLREVAQCLERFGHRL